jgi:hypothetical protein
MNLRNKGVPSLGVLFVLLIVFQATGRADSIQQPFDTTSSLKSAPFSGNPALVLAHVIPEQAES